MDCLELCYKYSSHLDKSTAGQSFPLFEENTSIYFLNFSPNIGLILLIFLSLYITPEKVSEVTHLSITTSPSFTTSLPFESNAPTAFPLPFPKQNVTF